MKDLLFQRAKQAVKRINEEYPPDFHAYASQDEVKEWQRLTDAKANSIQDIEEWESAWLKLVRRTKMNRVIGKVCADRNC